MKIFLLTLNADKNMDNILELYKSEKYKKACVNGAKLFHRGYKNEAFLSIIGDACAKTDYIYALSQLQNSLIKTESGRMNASYFATLVLQKKLVYQFFLDNLELGHLVLPQTGHILSILFEHIIKKDFTTLTHSPKKIGFSEGTKNIVAYIISDKKIKKVVVEVYKDKKLVNTHTYW